MVAGWALQVFYGFGFGGLLWVLWWEKVLRDINVQDPDVAERLQRQRQASTSTAASSTEEAVPWRAFLRSGPLRALAYTHFTNNWCAPVEVARTCDISRPFGVRPCPCRQGYWLLLELAVVTWWTG
jgi:hypothetical protein